MSNLLVNITLIIIMLGIGMSLSFNDFKNIFIFPKNIFIGFCSQILLLPLLAFSIAFLAPIEPLQKLGIVLIAFCPVGTTSNILIHLFKGNTALSISMTIVNSILSPFIIPIFISIATSLFCSKAENVNISFWESIIHIFFMVILPAFCGVLLNHFFPKIVNSCQKILKFLLPLLLLVVFSIKIFIGDDNSICSPITLHEAIIVAPFVILLNILGMYGGFFISKIFCLEKPSQLTVAIETGLQNTALALSISAILTGGCIIEKPILVYAMTTFFTAVIFLLIHSGLKLKDIFK
ncbi:MAG: bile acid:sodium symporter [Bacteroidales bacterium]|nr:bile acid:sodium symporter [Bacteroidales bacterium]